MVCEACETADFLRPKKRNFGGGIGTPMAGNEMRNGLAIHVILLTKTIKVRRPPAELRPEEDLRAGRPLSGGTGSVDM